MLKIVGILEADGINGRVVPDGKATDIREVIIHPENLNGAPFGMKVVVELVSSPNSPQALGKIVEVLGDPARPDVAMESILLMYGLSATFPENVLEELEKIPSELSEADIEQALKAGRRDLRDLKTITIDGKDARDLDDAISILKDGDGSYKLYVHIADVSQYVLEGSAIDREARERGNSVYLSDRVLPMLPPKLSNGICSINPNQARLAMTCMLMYDSSGSLIDGDVFESLISSDLRADYESVRNILESGQVVDGYAAYIPELTWMEELAIMLEKQSRARGSLEFNFPETKVEVDKEGNVLDIHAEETSFANEIIEQFMIAANSFVAERFTLLKLPFIYRIHDKPDVEKLNRFREVLKLIGDKEIRISDEPTPKEIAKVLQQVENLPAGKTLETLLLRALAKAIYSNEPIGHFGLALEDYSHFTAPIRRYADLFIHRIIKGFLRRELNIELWKKEAPELAEHISTTERTAILAERDSVDQKVAEYYAEHLGEVYIGEITGFVGAGMFVMLPSTAEGMVPFRTMNDYYVYDELTMTAQGRDKSRLFAIGDKVEVQVARADVVRRNIDFVLVDENNSGIIDKEFAKIKESRKRKNVEVNNKRKSGKSRKRYYSKNKSKANKSESYRNGTYTKNKSSSKKGRKKKF